MTLERLAILIVPFLVGLLAWFIKKHVEGTEKSIASLKDENRQIRDSLVKDVIETKVEVRALGEKVNGQNSVMREIVKTAAKHINETKAENLRFQNKMQDDTSHIIGQHRELQGEIKKVMPKLELIEGKVDKHAQNFEAMVRVAKSHQDKITVLEDKVQEIGKVIWVKDETGSGDKG